MTTITTKIKRGFGLIEVVVSTLIVSLMLVGSLTALASFTKSQEQDSLKAKSLLLANAVLTLITSEPYANISGTMGDEVTAAMQALDTIYEGSASNTNWAINYEVQYLAEDLSAPSVMDLGIKHIQVDIFYRGNLYHSMELIVTANLD